MALLAVFACATAPPRTVSRVVDGRVEEGPFVSPYAYEWFIEGEVRAAKGQHDEAAMAFESATAAPASDAVLLARLAEEYELSGASRRADRTLTVARRGNPNSARVALAQGRVYRKRGLDDDALAAFVRASALAPEWDAPVLATAATLAARGHRRRATALLFDHVENHARAHRCDAQRALVESARRTGDPEALMRAMALDPTSNSIARAHAAGELALARGRPALAARLLESDLDSRENVALWLRALVESGDRRRAVEFLMSAEGRRFANPVESAERLLALGAIHSARSLLKATGPSPRAGYLNGRAVLADGDSVRAAEILASVPVGAASLESSRLALAECSTRRRRSGAGAEALSQTPHGSRAVRRAMATFYIHQGDLRSALKLFDPKEPLDRAALAEVFERAGELEEASAYYASLEVPSLVVPRLRARASAEKLASRGRYRAAIAVLGPWTEVAPEDLHARVRLVELLIADGQTEEALKRGRATLPFVSDPLLRARLSAMLADRAVASN